MLQTIKYFQTSVLCSLQIFQKDALITKLLDSPNRLSKFDIV